MTQSARVEDDATELQVGRIADEFTDRLNRGDRPDVEQYARQHPHIAEILRQVLAPLVLMRRPASSPGSSPGRWAGHDNIPATLGDYRIIREIGRGGMGIVYEAEQQALGRRVALKVLPTHPMMDSQFLERFRREARAAAGLHHTNIVPVFGVGEHAAVHYYAMQYIAGRGLDDVLRDLRRPLECGGLTPLFDEPPSGTGELHAEPALSGPHAKSGVKPPHSKAEHFRFAARVALQVADALAYAHGQGVLHRDIKPSNLLLDGHGMIWVTDFGLAKTESSDNLTQLGDIVGTLRYMAPERFSGRSDERSDIYSLGLTLYEMLTLRPAFEETDRGRLIKQITHEEPVPPCRIDRRIPHDLETIVLKATAKDPADRYESGAELAEELRLFLADRPIGSRRATAAERVWRWGRRNPLVAGLVASVAVLLVTIGIGSSVLAVRLRTLLGRAEGAEADAKLRLTQVERADADKTRQLWESLLNQARFSRVSGRAGRRFDALDALAEAARLTRQLDPDEQSRRELRNEAIAAMALVDLRVDRRWPDAGRRAAHLRFGFDSALDRYAAYTPNGQIVVRGMADNAELARLDSPLLPTERPYLRFSPDGELLATKLVAGAAAQVVVWELASRQVVFQAAAGGAWHYKDLDFSPDGKLLAFADPARAVQVRDVGGAEPRQTIPLNIAPYHLSFSPDGQRLAAVLAGADDDPVSTLVFELATRQQVLSLAHPMLASSVAWSRDGTRLATACYDRNVYLWDAATGQQLRVCQGHRGKVIHVAFNRSGDLLLSAAWDMTTRLWDARSGEQLVETDQWGTEFGADDRRLGFGVPGAAAGRWAVAAGDECRVLAGHAKDSQVVGLAFAPDGRLLASASRHDGIRLWDAAAGRELGHIRTSSESRSVAFEPDGRQLITAGTGVSRWPLELLPVDGSASIRVGPPVPLLQLTGRVNCVAALSTDGQRLVAGSPADRFVVLDAAQPESQTLLAEAKFPDLLAAISPDGRWAAFGRKQAPGVARVWNAQTGELCAELPAVGGSLVAFSPDGRWLVVATDGELVFYEVGTSQELRRLRLDGPGFTQAAFSHDMRLLAVTSGPEVRLLDPAGGGEIARLRPPREVQLSAAYPEGASAIAFSPDSSRLAAGSVDGPIFVWDLARIREQLAAMGLDWDHPAYSIARNANESEWAGEPVVRAVIVRSPAAGVDASRAAAGPSPPAGRALQFDGTDDFVRVPPFSLGGALTIEAWVNCSDASANYARILDFGYGRSSNNIILGWHERSGRMLWEIYNGGSSGNLRVVSPEPFPLDRWVYVAAVVEANGTGTLYWDGEPVATGRLQVPETASRALQYIGRSNWPGDAYFAGRLAELRIWTTARPATAIRADMNRILGGDEPHLSAYWRLDDASGRVATDRTPQRRHARLQGGTWLP